MTGPSSDPRLLGAAWANEQGIAEGQEDAVNAKKHRSEDYRAARSRTAKRSRPEIVARLRRLFRRSG